MSTVTLTTLERNDLQYHEGRIKKGMAAFLEVADALTAIRDGKLYRNAFDTFAEYCTERWNFTDRRARQLMTAAEVVNGLPSEIGTIVPNEGVARELSKIEPSRRAEVVLAAKRRREKSFTAKDVKSIAEGLSTLKRGRFTMPDRGMFLARGAVSQLEQILPDDGEREQAHRDVRDHCDRVLAEYTRKLSVKEKGAA